MSHPPTTLSLDWRGGMSFDSGEGSPAIRLASSANGVTSPTQALAYAVMACMAIDIVHILEKGRHRLDAMHVAFEGVRAETPPRRYLSMRLRFDLTGDIPDHVVQRAIDLSRDKYCSVWHTLKDDVEMTTAYSIRQSDGPPKSKA